MAVPIASRSSWGARHDDGDMTLSTLATEVFAHHSVTAQLSPSASVAKEQAQMRAIESVGESRFGTGISYNVLIFPSGRAYQGASWWRRGTHTGGRNSTARSICFAGNYETNKPTLAQIATAGAIYAEGRGKWWANSAPLRGHRDVKQTACPGKNVYAELPAIRAGRITPAEEEFLMALSDERQEKLAKDADKAAVRSTQATDKLDRIEADLKARRELDLKHMAASADRDLQAQKEIAGLTAAVQVLAENQGLPADQILDLLTEKIAGIQITVTAS